VNKKLLKDNLIAKWLDNSLSEEQKKELENSGELDELKVVLDEIDTWKVKKFDTENGLAELKKRKKLVIAPPPPKKSSFSNRWLQIAASILILVSAGYFSWNFFFNQTITIKTQIAENKTIELPSGSIVKLDAASEISYKEKNWNDNRTIHLNGQAFFDVTKGTSFNVITDKGNINVLGTQFNVNASDAVFEVICYEGKVKVAYQNDELILTKGESAVVQENELKETTHISTSPDWTNGYSKYNQTSLPEVITDLKKYYTIKIQLPKKYENLEFTGTLTHKDLDTALQTLFVTMEIKYVIGTDNTVIFE
jgi:ferric-dicitrate binding protein FerR (iron transport regulator)